MNPVDGGWVKRDNHSRQGAWRKKEIPTEGWTAGTLGLIGKF